MLKPLDDILLPDPIHAHFAGSSGFGPVTLQEHHASIEALALDDAVPVDIATVWDRALNVFLYSWYCYKLVSVAPAQALMTLELALRRRLGPRADGSNGLQCLIERAVKDSIIIDTFRRPVTLAETAAKMRNHWLHGTANVADPNAAIQTLELCKAMIVALYPIDAPTT